jgi:leader peptidase (prepilin peptidase) / N-methyltransferase
MITLLLEYISQEPTLYIPVIGLFSLVVGSFLNVAIHRIPLILWRDWHQQAQEFLTEHSIEPKPPFSLYNLWIPRSHCPNCQQMIAAWDNFPVISYLLLRGKCRYCEHPISARYPLTELLTLLLSLFAAWHFGWSVQLGATLLITWALIVLSFIDFDHQLLPDDLTLGLVWLGLLLSIAEIFTDSTSAIIGAATGYSILWSINYLFRLYTGKEGMGYGDFKLLAGLGACLGWQWLLLILLISSMTGAVTGISLIIFKKQNREQPIPFGPFLAFGGIIVLYFGPFISSRYWQ